MLEDARQVLAANRQQVNGHAASNGLNGTDDMGNLILGDSVTNVHQAKPSSPWKWLALAAGIGVPALMAPAIIEAFKDDPAPVEQPEFIDTDTDTQFELHLGRPD